VARHDVTDKQWELVADLFPKRKGTGRPPKSHREILNAMLWILHTGAQWRDLPERYPNWKTVHHRFTEWRANGLIDRLLKRLQMKLDADGRIDVDFWCVDATVIRASRSAAGALHDFEITDEPEDHALGRSQGGFSTKLHVVTDGNGIPLDAYLTPGQTHEAKAFEPLMNSARERLAVRARAKAAKTRRRRQGL
jgi:transposase